MFFTDINFFLFKILGYSYFSLHSVEQYNEFSKMRSHYTPNFLTLHFDPYPCITRQVFPA